MSDLFSTPDPGPDHDDADVPETHWPTCRCSGCRPDDDAESEE
jgi:hypothetical protein